MRLNRYLSQCGLGSRRGCEQIILEGRVSLNGKQVKELGTQVEPEDEVLVDGRAARAETGVVIVLNKPRGYICTRSDERDRMTIYDLLPKQFQTLHHVGRLDKDSEGLILLTNRGDLSHRLIHPSMGAEKEYEVIVDQPLDQGVMAKLVKGMLTEEGHAKAERAWMITEYRAHLVLKQGLKRQIRLMMYQLGFEVERLTRTRIGWLELRGLPRGGWKELSNTEVERFFSKEGTGRTASNSDKPRIAVNRGRTKKKAVKAEKDEAEFDSDLESPSPRATKRPAIRGKGKPRPGLRSRAAAKSNDSEAPRATGRGFGKGKPRTGAGSRSRDDDDSAAPRSRSPSSRFAKSDESDAAPRSRGSFGKGKPRTGAGSRSRDDDSAAPRSRAPSSRFAKSDDSDAAPRSRSSFGKGDKPRGGGGKGRGFKNDGPARERRPSSSSPSSRPASKRPPAGGKGRRGR